ncbi:single-stranded DNA-binding protein, partial [Nocardiopsis sp. NPDC007018]
IVQGRLKQRSFETREGEKRTVFEIDVEEVGPALRSATAKVTKTQRQGGGGFGGNQGGGGFGGGQPQGGQSQGGYGNQGGGFGGQQGGRGGAPADDPWATNGGGGFGGGNNGGFSDEPPF